MGLGYEASVSANTRPHFGTTRSTRTSCRELTDGDLEKLGVLLGHRKRLLKAIAESGRRADQHRVADRALRSIVTNAPSAARSR